MTAEVYGLLRECVSNKEPGDHVFTRANNEPVRDFRGAWYSLCERADLGKFVKGENKKTKWEGLLFHDLRRSGFEIWFGAECRKLWRCVCRGTKPEVSSYAMTSRALVTLRMRQSRSNEAAKCLKIELTPQLAPAITVMLIYKTQ
jgi:hypothetical protein